MYWASSLAVLAASERSPGNEGCELVTVWGSFPPALWNTWAQGTDPCCNPCWFLSPLFSGVARLCLPPNLSFRRSVALLLGDPTQPTPPLSELQKRPLSTRIQGGYSSMGDLTMVLLPWGGGTCVISWEQIPNFGKSWELSHFVTSSIILPLHPPSQFI